MAEEIYSLIYVLINIAFLASDFWKPESEDTGRSELHSCHRYAVAEQIYPGPANEDLQLGVLGR